MVLIRSADASDTVYVVSFVDLESADAFARFEAKRGMNLGFFLIYWAEIVTIEAGEHGVQLTPEAPPRAGAAVPRLAAAPVSPPAPAASVVEDASPAPEPVPAAEAFVEERPSAPIEPALEPSFVPEPQPEPGFVAPEPEPVAEVIQPEPEPVAVEEPEPVTPEPEPVAETAPLFAATAPEPVAEPESRIEVQFVARPPEAEPVAEAPVEREPEAEPVAALETAPASPDGDEDMDIEREAAEFLKASSNGQKMIPPADPWQPAEVPPAYAAETYRDVASPALNSFPVETTVLETEESARASAPVRPWDPGPADEDSAEEEEENSEYRVQEVEKILNVKRWDKKDSPFRGFDSPPGRF
jgi:hypothetical protein